MSCRWVKSEVCRADTMLAIQGDGNGICRVAQDGDGGSTRGVDVRGEREFEMEDRREV